MSNAGPLTGQVGIVTGAGKGLGRAFAVHLASLGARVVVNNRNRTVDDDGLGPADHVVAQIKATGGEAITEYSDVRDPAAADNLITAATDAWGQIDFLVANAAISGAAMFHKSSDADFESVIEANVYGTTRITLACARIMRQNGYGRIVLVASTGGLHGAPTLSAYATSKGAVLALGRSIAQEMSGKGVLTNVLMPYATTPMTGDGMDSAYREEMTPEAVAPIVSALVDPRSSTNGETIVCGGGSLRVASAVEWDTAALPPGPVSPADLSALLTQSRSGQAHTYPTAHDAFLGFAAEATR